VKGARGSGQEFRGVVALHVSEETEGINQIGRAWEICKKKSERMASWNCRSERGSVSLIEMRGGGEGRSTSWKTRRKRGTFMGSPEKRVD